MLNSEKLISLIDWTRLEKEDSSERMLAFSQKAKTPLGHVAGVCIFPKWINYLKKELGDSIPLISVANFPSGEEKIDIVLKSVFQSIENGVSEIDVVIPYKDYISGSSINTKMLLSQCRTLCNRKVLLKAILETGALKEKTYIQAAARDAINCGVDFIKTSTGITTGASIEAVKWILEIKKELNSSVGVKVSGGIKTKEDAEVYVKLVSDLVGVDFVKPNTFRIGSSRILYDIFKNSV